MLCRYGSVMSTIMHPFWNILVTWCLLCGVHGDIGVSNSSTNETEGTPQQTPEPEIVNDGLPDAKAYVGRLFEYSLAENHIFGNTSFQIKVEDAATSNLPEWLFYDSNRRRLLGVPSYEDVGDTYISVATECVGSAPCFKDLFLLQVENSQYGFRDQDPSSYFVSNPAKDSDGHGCENDLVITNIVFCISPDKLYSADKIKLLSDMSEFLSLPVSKLMLLSSSGQKLRALEDGFQIVSAGPGNAGLCDEDKNVELSWDIPCSTLKHLTDFVSILQHNIEVGRIQQESGVKVVGWYIASTNAENTLSHKRRRRRAWRTYIPTPVLSPSTPTKVQTMSTDEPSSSTYVPPVYKPGLPVIQIAFRSTEAKQVSSRTAGIIQPTQTEMPVMVTEESQEKSSKDSSSDIYTSSERTEAEKTIEVYAPSKSIPDLSPTVSSDFVLQTNIPSFFYTYLEPTITSSLDQSSQDVRASIESSSEFYHPSSQNIETTPLPTVTSTSRQTTSFEILTQSSRSDATDPTYRPIITDEVTADITPKSTLSHLSSSSRHSTEDMSVPMSSSSDTPAEFHPSWPAVFPSTSSSKSSEQTIIESRTSWPSLPSIQDRSTASVESTETSGSTSSVAFESSTSGDLITTSSGQVEDTSSSSKSIESSTSSSTEEEPAKSTPVYEGSATDTDLMEGSGSGDKPEEGSAQGSGDHAFVTDDEDDLKSNFPGSGFGSTYTPLFSSSVTYLPRPEDGDIRFEDPTDIYVDMDESESMTPSIVPYLTTQILVASSSVIPNILPPVHEEAGAETTTSFMKPVLRGTTDRVDDRTTTVSSQDGSFTEQTTHGISEGVVIEGTDDPKVSTTSMYGADSKNITKESHPIQESKPISTANLTITDLTAAPTTTPGYQAPSGPIGRSTTRSDMYPASTSTWEDTTKKISLSTTPSTEVVDLTNFGTRSTEQSTLRTSILDRLGRTTVNPNIFYTSRPLSTTEFSFETHRPNNKKNGRRKGKDRKKDKKRKKQRKNKTTTSSIWDTKTIPPFGSSSLPPFSPSERNQKPYLENSIDYIEATLGEYFEYEIPRNVFYDIEDGDTKNLQLSLTLPYNQALPPTFWLQLDPRRQILKGIPLAVDLDTGYQNVNLIARDRGGLTETDSIKLRVNSSTFGKFTHKFIMRFGVDFAKFMNNRSNLNNLIRLIANYFGDKNVDDLTILDVSVGSLILTWTNNTLNGNQCDNNTISKLYSRMVRRDGSIRTSLNRHFGKDIPIEELEYRPTGACSDTMTTTLATTTLEAEKASDDTGLSIWAQVVLPVMVSLLVILLIVLLVLLINRRRKKKPEPTTWDKPVFNNDRNPIIFPEELEREEATAKPKKQTTGASDVTGSLSSRESNRPYYYFEDDPESNNSTLNSERSRNGTNKRPPKAPPPYWQPHSDPPPYRLPPPYAPQQTNV